ncbi:MAG: NADH-quinone oxidoreductase subunit C [Thermodesulfobacteriota bacterium]
MDAQAIFEKLKGKFGAAVVELQSGSFNPNFVVVDPRSIREICRFLKEDPELRFGSVMCISGVDYKDRFAVAYHLNSMELGHSIGIKAHLPHDNPSIPSVDPVWKAAIYQERETYDLVGIVFEGSCDPNRILLPDDWEGHPLRKDYQYPEHYHGIKI